MSTKLQFSSAMTWTSFKKFKHECTETSNNTVSHVLIGHQWSCETTWLGGRWPVTKQQHRSKVRVVASLSMLTVLEWIFRSDGCWLPWSIWWTFTGDFHQVTFRGFWVLRLLSCDESRGVQLGIWSTKIFLLLSPISSRFERKWQWYYFCFLSVVCSSTEQTHN